MYSTAVLKIDSASKIRANWLRIPQNSAIFGQNSANFRQFTHINFNLYHYAGNNPVKYVDPDGRKIRDVLRILFQQSGIGKLGPDIPTNNDTIAESGCVLTAYTRIANDLSGANFTLDQANKYAVDHGLFDSENKLTAENGAKLINGLCEEAGSKHRVVWAGTIPVDDLRTYGSCLNELETSTSQCYVTARLHTTDKDGTNSYDHTVNINSGSVITGDLTDIANSLNSRVNDTSRNTDGTPVRKQVANDARSNTLLKSDYFRVVQ